MGTARRAASDGALGVGSLFVYWVHVELVYGVATKPLRHALTLEQCVVAWALFSLAMFALLLGWNALAADPHLAGRRAVKAFKIRYLDGKAAGGSLPGFTRLPDKFSLPLRSPQWAVTMPLF